MAQTPYVHPNSAEEFMAGVVVPLGTSGTAARLKMCRFFCAACGKKITVETRVRCAECEAEGDGVDLCLVCFGEGKEFGVHRKNHKYRVASTVHEPLFTNGWDAEEELLLLEGILLFSFGNWSDVADHVGTKGEEECLAHYTAVYGEKDEFPAPLGTKLTPNAARPLSIKEYLVQKKHLKKPPPSNPIKAELGGYMPNRGEFELPYNDQADLPVADLVFEDDDTAEQRKIKMDAMQVYHMMLEERRARKRFVVENKLLKWKQQKKFQRSLSFDDDKRLLQRMRPFLQVMSRSDWDQFVSGMLAEKQLRRRIQYYKKLRRDGITSEQDVEEYHTKRKKRTRNTPRTSSRHESHDVMPSRLNSFAAPSSGGGINIANAPQLQFLSESEKAICKQLALMPVQYIMLKEAMVREFCRTGCLTKKEAALLAVIEPHKLSVLYDFFVSSGWISATPADFSVMAGGSSFAR